MITRPPRRPLRIRRNRGHPFLAVWLTGVWVLLWSDLSLANVIGGALVAVVLTTFLYLNPVPFHGGVHPRGLVSLLVFFLRDLVLAALQVAYVALRPRRVPRGAVIRVRLRSHSDVILTMTAELCSLIPGSIVIEAHRLTGTLYVHLLDAETSGGLEKARAHVLEQERRLLYAFAAADEIAEAGLPPRPAGRRRREAAGRDG